MIQIKPANIWLFYFRDGERSSAGVDGGVLLPIRLAGEFNSFRYKYISSGRAWEITFAGIMAKTRKPAWK